MYSKFASNYEKSSNKLIELKKTSKFQTFLSEQMRRRTKGKTLASLLLSPIQRVPRYRLLLQELLEHTEVGKDDHSDLKLALESISKVALNINERISIDQENDNMLKVLFFLFFSRSFLNAFFSH